MALKYINKLEGKLVIIIGGTSGIGFAVAEACVEHGARVVVASRKQQNVDSTVAALKKAYPDAKGDIRGHTCDTAADDAESEMTRLFGYATDGGTVKVDHVVDTAGETGSPIHGLQSVTSEDLAKVQKSRVIGPILLAKVVQKYIKPESSSSFTMTSGVLTFRPFKAMSMQIAAGGGREVMTRALAVEMAPIRVNVVSPGAIQTPLLDLAAEAMGGKENMRQYFASTTLVNAVGTVEDCAEAYLCAIKNNFMTGTVLHAEGGTLLKT
ncbi:uncharacterized protein HMPREF1541_08972 [Cyphellophora europaea CBS 101466]|uniref:Uncharacterized protein n=1 Tax=Cyphellophora europaea (strain CBS 101466) TaxID=1220924 RepID=W2RLT2_CYPE1|nr:uncharacterized protein HMPREF1541_08972 [Cyphellophora europaea CBS 101466]ETN36694.1 hypothetical protein HMPREF1541_08972 [Cyphellophora europaea CBS 101466]